MEWQKGEMEMKENKDKRQKTNTLEGNSKSGQNLKIKLKGLP